VSKRPRKAKPHASPGSGSPSTIELKKRLGQHHLRHPELCAPLLDHLRLDAATVVEIGPGGGVLTRQLVDRAARVWAIELDPEWAFHLARSSNSAAGRTAGLVIADALDFPWHRLAAGTRVTGNLPYSVATVLIERLLDESERLDRQGYLVQLEVAERLCAQPGDKPYGSLSVIVAARMRGRLLNRVRPGSFHPPPRVDSAFVALEAREPVVPGEQWPTFKRHVRWAFAQRRKTLLNSLSAALPRTEAGEALARAGIDPGRRAETLALEEFVELHRVLQLRSPPTFENER
jgi:16S rRNA (adenine1518-N6/adenine1519-N6)-dimethyltransferase